MTTAQRVDGVDISHHQSGNIGWRALKDAGVKWMYHKATEGVGFKDSMYVKRRNEARAAHMPFGAYHFARPSLKDARSEAKFFISVAEPRPGDLRPALDLETTEGLSGAQLSKWADEFCDEVQKLTSVMPLIYTPFTLSPTLERMALFWVPRYNNSNTPPTRSWDIWQFSNGVFGVPHSVPGLGNVDLNTSKVHLTDLLIPKAAEPVLTSRGANVDAAIGGLTKAEKRSPEGTERDRLLDRALRILRKIKPTKP